MKRLAAIATSLCLLGASCGETNIDAIARLRPRGAETRARLQRIAAILPASPLAEARPPPTGFVPPLVLDFDKKGSTAEVLMEEQLRDPDVDLSARLDLMLSRDLLNCLLWTGPQNPLDQSVWDDRSDLGPECERAFRTRWLVVVRTAAYALPERVRLDVFVVDMQAISVVAAFPLELRGSYARADVGSGPWATEALRQLRSDAFVAARCEVGALLARLPGARITLEQSFLGVTQRPCAGSKKSFRAVSPPPPRAPLEVPAEPALPGAEPVPSSAEPAPPGREP